MMPCMSLFLTVVPAQSGESSLTAVNDPHAHVETVHSPAAALGRCEPAGLTGVQTNNR